MEVVRAATSAVGSNLGAGGDVGVTVVATAVVDTVLAVEASGVVNGRPPRQAPPTRTTATRTTGTTNARPLHHRVIKVEKGEI